MDRSAGLFAPEDKSRISIESDNVADVQGDLFNPSLATPVSGIARWKKYLTGGEYGPGGKFAADAAALRKEFLESEEAAEMGWAGKRDKLLYRYKSPEEQKAAREKAHRERDERYRSFKRGA